MDPRVILETILKREEITAIEALLLLREGQAVLPELRRIADEINRRSNRNVVTYVRSKQVHFTNICRIECSFCSFWKRKGQKGAVTLSPAEVVRQIRDAGAVRQVVLQGGLNPDLGMPYHLELLRTVREAFPNVHIHGYSPSEVHFLSKRSRATIQEVLRRFREAGLDSLSGDSADILNDKVRKKICSDKLRTGEWAEVIRTAHRLGLPTTATILFGHVEDEITIVEHLEIIRNLQRETGGFTAFEPLAFVPNNTDLARSARIRGAVAVDRLQQLVAIARIFLGRSIRNISIDWTKTGIDLAVGALSSGANDLGSLSYDAFEIRLPELNGRGGLAAAAMRSAIQKVGRVPQERDAWRLGPAPASRSKRREELVLA
jgi:CofH subfamily radical SAM domain protein